MVESLECRHLLANPSASYDFTPLNDPLATKGTFATAISGATVVGQYINAAGHHSFIYSGHSYTTLPDAPGAAAGSTYAEGISGNTVSGYYTDGSGVDHGFVYSGGVFATINDPAATSGPTASGTALWGVEGGNTVGFYFTSQGPRGFVDSGGAFTSLQAPSSVKTYALATSSGAVVGYDVGTLGNTSGFLYEGGSFTPINDPAAGDASVGSQDNGTFGRAVAGNIVAGYYFDPSGVAHGFLEAQGAYTTVDDPLATDGTSILGLQGTTLVGGYFDATGQHGFIATAAPLSLEQIASATSAGAATGQTRLSVSVGAGTSRTYRFTMAAAGVLAVQENEGTPANFDVSLYDGNGNYVDRGDTSFSTRGDFADRLPGGTYYIQFSNASLHSITDAVVAVTAEVAGPTLASAYNAGVISGGATFIGYIGSQDLGDLFDVAQAESAVYRFSSKAMGTVTLASTDLPSAATLELVRDSNGNGKVDAGEVLALAASTAPAFSSGPASLAVRNLPPGTYYAEIDSNRGSASNFNLAITAPAPVSSSPTAYLINCGGSSSYRDHNGNTWSADEYYSGGSASDTPFSVPGTQDGIVFYDRRTGSNFGYNLPIQNGTYTVQFFFTDPTYTKAGQRLFNVGVQGNTVLNRFDIIASGGGKRPITRALTVMVSNGVLAISFAGVVNGATVSGIQVIKH